MSRLTISHAAKAAGVTVETIRFYERRGLIGQPRKPQAGAREYDEGLIARIRFIRQALEIGFSLREIDELLALRADPEADCADVRLRAVEKRQEVDVKLARLELIRRALDVLIANCPGGGAVKGCTILGALEDASMPDIAGKSNLTRPLSPAGGVNGGNAMQTTILDIEGMHCKGCARTVEALLRQAPGVQKAEASYEEKRARVLHDAGLASAAVLAAIVAQGGYKAKERKA